MALSLLPYTVYSRRAVLSCQTNPMLAESRLGCVPFGAIVYYSAQAGYFVLSPPALGAPTNLAMFLAILIYNMLDVLHWLPLQQRISYRIIALVLRSLLGLAPLIFETSAALYHGHFGTSLSPL